VDVVGIFEWLGSATDDGKRGRDVGCPWRVGELHFELHSAFDVELADEIGLDDEIGDVLRFESSNRVEPRTKTRSTGDARSNSLLISLIQMEMNTSWQ
jgi:hypothetical protein